jgi:hypothetical protein
MAEGPDPLGKRALYWMPVDPEAEGDAESDGPGLAPGPTAAHGPRHARPAGKHALFSDATPTGESDRSREAALSEDPVPARGPLTVACSRCGAITRIGLVEFLVLQFPIGAWLPGRTYDRWMTCPACRNRTWISATFTR